MGDYFDRLVDTEVSLADAPLAARRVIAEFTQRGLIAASPDAAADAGNLEYQGGPALPAIYEGAETKQLKCFTFKIEIVRQFNYWAFVSVEVWLQCRACAAVMSNNRDDVAEALLACAAEWISEEGTTVLTCPQCGVGEAVDKWQLRPSLGFGNLHYAFANCPPLDDRAWRISFAELIARITGHRIEYTYGKI